MTEGYGSVTATMPVEALGADARGRFIARTYNHLFGAIIAFVLIEWGLFSSGLAEKIAVAMLSVNWMIILGAFMLVSWLASRAANNSTSMGVQYAALGGFVLAEAIIFVPLLYVANFYAPGAIESAALVTLLGFAILTGIAFWTRKDFSFLGALLRWIAIAALVAIVASLFLPFQLGTWFMVGMVVFAGAAILYDTSNVIHHFPVDRHVGASLQLFASVALMFWYVLQLFLSRD